MAKVLIVISEFYPLQNATANCVINLCRRFKQFNDSMQFDVLCFKTNSEDDLESYFDFFHIFRINKKSLIDKQSFFSDSKNSVIDKLLFVVNKILFKIQKIVCSHPWRLGYKELLKGIRTLNKKNSYDYLLCVSGNYCSSYSGAIFKKESPIKLITYLTDPLIENPLYASKRKRNLLHDFDIIYSSSTMLAVTPIIYSNLKNKDKILPLEFPSFFEKETYTHDSKNIVFQKNKINLLYTGIFYPKIRTPDFLIKLLMNLPDDFVLHICGSVSKKFLSKYKEAIDKKRLMVYGNINHQLLFNAISDCDFLVNVGNNTSYMLPSKLISYISTGKPIINIVKISNCPTLSYLFDYPNYVNIYENNRMEDNLNLLLSFVFKPHQIIPKKDIYKMYERCTTDYVASQFYKNAFSKRN